MAEIKKAQAAGFAEDSNAFAGGSSVKGTAAPKKAQQKQSGVHQPRDADDTSGQNVQRSGQAETFGQDVQKQTKTSDSRKAKGGQRKQHRKQGAFGQSDKMSENADAGSQKKSDFTKENSTFTEDNGTAQEERQSGDDYRRRDTYHQAEKRGHYRRRKQREHTDRERTKTSDFEQDFNTKDNAFTEGEKTEFQGSKKLDKLQKKAEKAGRKTEAARRKLPKKTEYSLERVFDEKTGRAKYVLTAVKKEKPFKPDSPVKRMAGRAGSEFTNYAHGKVAEVEKENAGVEGAHKSEQKAEDAYRFVKRHHKNRLQRRREKVAKLEKKQFQKEVNFRYRKFLEENPEMQEKTLKKQLQKRLQKQRIKREYAKARRAGQAAKNTKEAAVKSANFTTTVAKKLQEAAQKHAALLVTIGAFAVLLIMIMTSISSCGAMFSDGMSTTLAGSYMSVPAEMDAADLAFSELEKNLQAEIDAIETDIRIMTNTATIWMP